MQMYLAGWEIKMLRHSKRCVHEYLGHRGQIFDTLHLQPKEVSVDRLSINSLKKKKRQVECAELRLIRLCQETTNISLKSSSHIVHVVLVRLNGPLQQRQPLCVLLTCIYTVESDNIHALSCTFMCKTLAVLQHLFGWVLHCLDEC